MKSESEVTQSCPTQQPHELQPTRLLCPWDFPGKSTGVGCHCLLRPADLAVANYVKVLGAIPTSVHVFASNRSAYLHEVDGNFSVAGVRVNQFFLIYV